MATSSVSNTFVNGTPADAAEVNTNFSDLVSFLNNSVVHRDGSKAMTSAFDAGTNKIINVTSPTSGSDAANKTFVDNSISTHNGVTTAHGISAFGATLVDDADAAAARTTLGLGALATLATVDTAQIVNDAVTTAKIDDGAVTEAKIAAAAKDTQYHTEAATTTVSSVTNTATPGAGNTMVTQTIVPAYSGIALITGTFDLECTVFSSPIAAIGELEVNAGSNVVQTAQALFTPTAAGQRVTVSQTWIVPVTASTSTTFVLSVRRDGTSSVFQCSNVHTTMNIVMLRS